MKITKLVTGVLSIVLFALVTFQSCAAGVSNALEKNGESGGTGGVFLAVCLLVAGIVCLVTRNNQGKGGDIACAIIYVIAGLIGIASAGSYSDLMVWSVIAFVFAAIHIISVITNRKGGKGTPTSPGSTNTAE